MYRGSDPQDKPSGASPTFDAWTFHPAFGVATWEGDADGDGADRGVADGDLAGITPHAVMIVRTAVHMIMEQPIPAAPLVSRLGVGRDPATTLSRSITGTIPDPIG